MTAAQGQIITVGVPARNEQATIEHVISALQRQKLPAGKQLEIIICVNGSHDKTGDIVRKMAESDPRIKLIETPVAGKPNALNLIAKRVSSEVLFFCDADTLVEDEAVKKMLAVFESNKHLHALTASPVKPRRKYRTLPEITLAALEKAYGSTQHNIAGVVT